MPVDQDERPTFYQGQYLGPEDLTAAVDYGRIQLARHILGGHTLGIAIGLQLIEKPSPAGNNAVDVFLEPGYAWDGFGRPIVVLSPYKVPAALFQNIVYDAAIDDPSKSGDSAAGRPVKIWLRYSEQANQPPAAGFAVCDVASQTSRVQETFALEIGELINASDQRDPVSVGGKTIDAQQALTAFDATADTIYDLSIPQQALPEDNADALWLIPVGYVRWLPPQTSTQAGAFQQRTPNDIARSEAARQYIGVVAGAVEAAGKNVQVRARGTAFSSLRSDDLLWVEGAMRVQGNANLYDGDLVFLNQAGKDDGVPLLLQRTTQIDPSTLQTLTSLQIEIGKSNQGNNLLSVGPLDSASGKLVQVFNVLDSGKAGVGTTKPRNPLGIRGSGGAEELLSFEDAAGNTKWHINQKVNGLSGLNFAETGVADFRLFIQAGGRIGIGTQSPSNRLHVDDVLGIRQKYLFLSGDQGWSSLTYNAYHDSGNQNWVFPDQARPAVTIEMDDLQNSGVPRFEVWSTLSSAKTTWVQRLAINGDSGDVYLAHHGGNVGIGTTTPTTKLQVAGGIKWANSSQLLADQGGSIELGGDGATPGSGTPFIDFHFAGLTQDFNTRIINDADGQLSLFAATVRVTGDLVVGGNRTYLFGLDPAHQHWIMAGGSVEGVHNAVGLIFNGGNNNLFHTGPGWTKGFLIDHPLEPEKKFLAHATLEGPEAAVFYRGESRLVDGKATIQLPDYFEALAREDGRTVLLTPMSESDSAISLLAASSVEKGSFTVTAADKKNLSQRFYWEVKAVRSDVGVLNIVNKKPSRPRATKTLEAI